MRYLCFRFDVDTHKCLRDGVPNLLKLSNRHQVKFTFFINVGKAVDRLHFFQNKSRPLKNNIRVLSPLKKLSVKDYIFISFLNPCIGKRYPEKIKMISRYGHEIGLHGGKNHQAWFNEAKTWSSKKIREELIWGMKVLKEIDDIDIKGFASPGWSGSVKINRILQKLGFLYVSDSHSDKALEKIIQKGGLRDIPTNIVGEPGGVGYIEYCRASNMNDSEILADFKEKINQRKKLSVVYDHPFYAGTKELDLINKMIELAKSMNVRILMLKDILNKI